jgi:hypothetical protein
MYTLAKHTWIVVAGLLVVVLLLMEVGRWLGLRHRAREGDKAGAGLGTLEGGIFALMGLLIAFTFSGAASRFDNRRSLIVEEANDIGTAYLRLDLLPADAQPALRGAFRDYVDARLEAYQALPDTVAAAAANARALALQSEIWSRSVAAATGNAQATMLLLPALNAMIDITTTRNMALRAHPPALIFLLLAVLVGSGALLAGFGMSANPRRSLIHVIGFAAMTAVTVGVILDFEFPRVGMVQVTDFDKVLVDVRASMK